MRRRTAAKKSGLKFSICHLKTMPKEMWLEILNLDSAFLVNDYVVKTKVLTEKRKIVDYFKE